MTILNEIIARTQSAHETHQNPFTGFYRRLIHQTSKLAIQIIYAPKLSIIAYSYYSDASIFVYYQGMLILHVN